LRSRRYALGAGSLDLAEGFETFLELAGQATALDGEVGDEPMGIDDVEGDFLVGRDGGCGASEHVGFEQRDAVEAPGGVDKLLDELRFGGSGGPVFVERSGGGGLHRRPGLRRGGRGKRRSSRGARR